MTLKFIDLFGGIGGFRLGLQQSNLNAECVAYYDIDKYAVKSYNAIFNEDHDPTDIAELDTGRIPDHDLICAGFPCQSFSIAGQRGGFDDTRGTLFFEIARIAKARKPAYLLLENVKGLLSHDDGETFKVILETLGELGYDVEWQVLNSRRHGVPQNRERVFLVGHLGGFSGQQVFPLHGATAEDPAEDAGAEGTVVSNDGRLRDYSGTVRSGGNSAMDDSDASFIVNKVADIPGYESFGAAGNIYSTEGVSPTIRAEEGGGNTPTIVNHQERPESRPSIEEEGQTGGSGLLYNSAYSYALSKSPHFVTQADDRGKIRVNRDDEKQSEIQGYSTFLPTAEYVDVVDNHDKNLMNGRRIRKLTPRECWRLQGFPDWAFEQAAELNSDTQLYKQAGNAVTVNVVKDIAVEIARIC